ncbi:hypothetical protein ACFQH6_03720 [Halobacteriaceae archaeon GCM10025711]
MAGERVNFYVPSHHVRGDDTYLFIKWWSSRDSLYAHAFRDELAEPYEVRALGRNGDTYHGAPLTVDAIPKGVRKGLQARGYELVGGESHA